MKTPVMRLVLVVCVCVLGSLAQDNPPCPRSHMLYSASARSCFLFSSSYSHYGVCKQYCPQVEGGDNYQAGHLARIMDKETDDLLKERAVDSYYYWIGLNDAVKRKQYRWEGQETQAPTYYGWQPGSPIIYYYRKHVVLSKSGWRKYLQSWSAYCLCELNAVVPPLQVGSKEDNAASCPIRENWSRVSWHLPRVGTEVVKCINLSNGPTTVCSPSNVVGYDGRIIGNTRIDLEISTVQRHDEGEWICDVAYADGSDEEIRREVKVYESATEINCYNNLSTSGLEVQCMTPRIYPEAECGWAYKYGDEDYVQLTALTSNQSRDSLNYTDYRNFQAWTSSCSLQLTMRSFQFRPGQLTIRVAMDPIIRGRDWTSHSSAYREHTVSIVEPKSPNFKYQNNTRLKDSVTLTTGQQLRLICFVYHGTPRVFSTTLQCDFPFTVNKENRQSVYTASLPGLAVPVTFEATASMNGKTCRCSGHHLIGAIESTELRFNIESPPTIRSFEPTVKGYKTFTEGHRIALVCQAYGNPTPIISIGRTESVNQVLVTSHDRGTAQYNITTKCSDTGQYTCRANNVFGGQTAEDARSVRLDVSCRPKLCSNDNAGMLFGANIGQEAKIRLCMFANPEPRHDLFQLIANKDNKLTFVNKNEYSLLYTTHLGAKGELSVRYAAHEDTFGNYSISYNGYTVADFQVVLKGAPFCPLGVTVLEVGHYGVSLEWNLQPSQEIDDSFVIFDLSRSDSPPYTELAEIVMNDDGTRHPGKMAYNLSGLDDGSAYNLSVGTRNGRGDSRWCVQHWVNITTQELLVTASATGDDSSGSDAVIIGVVIGLLILIIIVVFIVVFVIVRKKRKQPRAYTNMTSSSTPRPADEASDSVYAKVNKKPTEQSTSRDAPEVCSSGGGGGGGGGEDSDEWGQIVYANVNKNAKRTSNVNDEQTSCPIDEGDSAQSDNEESPYANNEETTYANSAQINSEDNIYNNQNELNSNSEAIYANATSVQNDDLSSTEGATSVQNDDLSSTEGATRADKKKGSSRELIYISVCIGSDNKVTMNEPDGSERRVAPPTQDGDRVEYTSIDSVATKRMEREHDNSDMV